MEYLKNRLELRRKRLEEQLRDVEQLLLRCKDGTAVLRQDIKRWQISLKQSISYIQSDMDRYVSHASPDDNLLELTSQLQMKGEEFLIELELIINVSDSQQAGSSSNNQAKTSVKLPKLELPKFDGDILKWTGFWDRFVANVHSQSLEDVEKLAYLLSSLEGIAKEAVQGLTMTNDNYLVAIDTLKGRYGHTHKVIDSHYSALNKIKRCDYTAEGCRRNLNDIDTHLRVLSSLGENKESNHLRSLIIEKFPDKVIYELNLLTSNDHSISSIRSTLDTIVQAMEKAQVGDDPKVLPTSSTEAFQTTARPIYHRGKRVFGETVKEPSTTNNFRHTSNDFRQTKKRNSVGPAKNIEHKRTKRSCIFCEGAHYNDECTTVTDVKERQRKLGDRCFRCLQPGHHAFKCTRQKKCYHCKGNHNRALCFKRTPPGIIQAHNNVSERNGPLCPKTRSFLQTAVALVVHNGKTTRCRLLLDSGSQRSYITTGLAKHLDLTSNNVDTLLIFTFGSKKPTETLSPCTDVVLRTKRGVEKSIHVNIVSHITDRIPRPSIPTVDNVDIFADSGSMDSQTIDMLIGNDYYSSFIRNRTIQLDYDLFLIDTDFGWVVSGHQQESQEDEDTLAVVTYHQSSTECLRYTEPDLPLRQSDIKFLWSLENIGITDSVKATRELEAIQHFNDTVVYHEGRYYVKWPWTIYPPELPTNYGLAYGRLKGLLQRFDRPTLQEYDEILMEQLQAGIIEIVEAKPEVHCQTVPPVHFLPHHIVKQSGKRGRIVYDASAKLKDQQSLNQCLYRGPCMLQDLTALLLNFRMYKTGIVADVEKAFLQVGLQEEDRNVTRFLWVKDVNKPLSNENLIHLRFCRVPFGVISSPFLLTATIRHHIVKKNSELLKNVVNKCYVDNLVTGTNTTEEAIQLFDETKNTFKELSMNLRDWTSNNKSFIKKVPAPYRAEKVDEVKVLGLMWNKTQDLLTLNINKDVLTDNSWLEKITKREVLRTLASIYDPCGIVTPLLMPIKLFLQLTWKKEYKWDAPLPKELVQNWKKIKRNLEEIKNVAIPRYVEVNVKEETENELHCFTDASKDSYAAVVYFRSNDGSKVNISILMSKGRVVPLTKEKKGGRAQKGSLTTPQLELLGCIIGNRLLTYLKENLEVPIHKQYIWTDSLVVLNWIHSSKLLPPFISNRIEEIKRNIGLETFYVNTKENPADIATRPELWTHKKDVWLKGPSFLSKGKKEWPTERFLRSHIDSTALPAVAEGLKKQSSDINIPMELEEPKVNQNQERSQVENIKYLQQTFFPEEMKGVQTDLSRNLRLFTDVDGLLRCKGRMMHANWSYDKRYPILLPRDCEFTRKIVKEIHEENYHVGAPHTLSLVRQQFWIPKGRPVVERILKKCPQCVKHGGGPYPLPPTPALPAERVNYSTPFTYTGIDYFGHVYVDTKNGQQKRWVCLFTCLAVRAIHMEVVQDLTADECIMALRRFTSARGIPVTIVSDNALYFKLSSEILNSEYSVKNSIRWKFIPQLAPWHGAFYERLVGLVKHCMKRTLEKLLLSDTQLLTVIKEIEAVVNSRPLTQVGPDMDEILRPCDFLSLGHCLNLELSEDGGIKESDSLVKQKLIAGWRRGQTMVNQFKMMFINQYLTSLRERYRHSPKQPRVKSYKEPNIGRLVQIKGESKNRNTWKVGRIVRLIQSPDGHCRVAQVQVNDRIFTRSIGHLYPLEVEEASLSEVETNETTEPQVGPQGDSRQNMPDTVLTRDLPQEVEPIGNLIEKQRNPRVDSTSIEEVTKSTGKDFEKISSIIPQQPMQEGHSETPHLEEVVDLNEEDIILQDECLPRERVTRRAAAIRARERIAEWTRQLFTHL